MRGALPTWSKRNLTALDSSVSAEQLWWQMEVQWRMFCRRGEGRKKKESQRDRGGRKEGRKKNEQRTHLSAQIKAKGLSDRGLIRRWPLRAWPESPSPLAAASKSFLFSPCRWTHSRALSLSAVCPRGEQLSQGTQGPALSALIWTTPDTATRRLKWPLFLPLSLSLSVCICVCMHVCVYVYVCVSVSPWQHMLQLSRAVITAQLHCEQAVDADAT